MFTFFVARTCAQEKWRTKTKRARRCAEHARQYESSPRRDRVAAPAETGGLDATWPPREQRVRRLLRAKVEARGGGGGGGTARAALVRGKTRTPTPLERANSSTLYTRQTYIHYYSSRLDWLILYSIWSYVLYIPTCSNERSISRGCAMSRLPTIAALIERGRIALLELFVNSFLVLMFFVFRRLSLNVYNLRKQTGDIIFYSLLRRSEHEFFHTRGWRRFSAIFTRLLLSRMPYQILLLAFSVVIKCTTRNLRYWLPH